jgi:hypothetical protein
VGSYALLVAWFFASPLFSGGFGISSGSLGAATGPFSAIDAAIAGRHGGALLGFFLFYAALILAIWHIARLEVEMLRDRDE